MASARALNVSSRAGNAHFQTKKNTIAKANIPATSSDVAGKSSSKPEELSSASSGGKERVASVLRAEK